MPAWFSTGDWIGPLSAGGVIAPPFREGAAVRGELAAVTNGCQEASMASANPEGGNEIQPSEAKAVDAGRPELSVGNESVSPESESKASNGRLERGMEAAVPQDLGSVADLARDLPRRRFRSGFRLPTAAERDSRKSSTGPRILILREMRRFGDQGQSMAIISKLFLSADPWIRVIASRRAGRCAEGIW
jgi:hypothetical protein